MVLCDTNIFIHAFNGRHDTISRMEEIGLQQIGLSVHQVPLFTYNLKDFNFMPGIILL